MVFRDSKGILVLAFSFLGMALLPGCGSVNTTPGTDPTPTPTPTPTPSTATIAFASNRTGSFNLYLLKVADKSVQRLTTSSADDMSPSWSPDGNKIAFASNRAGKFGIYVKDLASGGETALVGGDRDNLHPSWSPDGKKIAFIRQEEDTTNPTLFKYGLYLVDPIAGTELTKESRIDNMYSKVQYPLSISNSPIYDIEEVHLGNSRPAWTPDSTKIIIESWAHVFTQAANSMIEFDLVHTDAPARGILENQGIGSSYDSWVDVSPDGTKIALGCSPRVGVVDFNGGIVAPILPADSDIAAAPKWSKDGKQIAYSVVTEGNRDIYIVDTAMTATPTGMFFLQTRLTEDPADDRTPAWKP